MLNLGCFQNTEINSSSLSSFAPAPTFSGTVSQRFNIPTLGTGFVVSGSCSSMFAQTIEWSSNGTAWQTPVSGDADCSDGSFSINMLSDAVGLWAPHFSNPGDSKVFYIRYSTSAFMSSGSAQITVSYLAANTKPIVTHNCSSQVSQGTLYTCGYSIDDPDVGDTHTWFYPTNTCSSWLANGSSSGTPQNADVGTCQRDVYVDDGALISDTVSFNIYILNAAPSLMVSDVVGIEDSPITFTDAMIQANEEMNGSTSYSFVTASGVDCRSVGSISGFSAITGAFTFNPNANQNGLCNFKIIFDDGSGASVAEEFQVNLVAVNDSPFISGSCSLFAQAGEIYSCALTGGDVDGDSLTWSLDPSHTCTVLIDNAGAITGTITNPLGTCTLAVKVNDSLVDSILYTANITVTHGLAHHLAMAALPGSFAAGNQMNLTVTVQDSQNNTVTSSSDIITISKISGAGSLNAISSSKPASSGVAFFSTLEGLNITVAGSGYQLSASASAIIGANSNIFTIIPGVISLSQSLVSVSSSMIQSGSTSVVTLSAKDQHGNSLPSGGDTIGFSSVGGASTGAFGSVTDMGDGTYTAGFAGIVAGSPTSISATINGWTVTSSLPTIQVIPGAYSLVTSAVGVASPSISDVQSTTVTLTARDMNSNVLNSVGLTVTFAAGGAGSAAGYFDSTIDNLDGTYAATFHALVADGANPLTITAFISGGPVTNTNTITIYSSYLALSVESVYPSFSNWNDYVNNNGPDIYSATGVVCSSPASLTYNQGCIHSGEKRKVEVTGYSSCANLTISENLNAFDWVCIDTSGTAIFYTKSLAPNMGLRDLINGSGNWYANYVEVRLSGVAIGSSAPSLWWSNAIAALPANVSTDTPENLNVIGKIYYLDSNRTISGGYHIAADKVAVVSLGTSLLTYTGYSANANTSTSTGLIGSNSKSILMGGTRKHIWLEINMAGSGTFLPQSGLTAVNWNYSRIHRTTIAGLHTGVLNHAMFLKTFSSNLVTDLSIYKAAAGVEMSGATYNTFVNLQVADILYNNSLASMLKLISSSNFNRFYFTRLTNLTGPLSNALYLNSNNNVFNELNISNISGALGGINFGTAGISNIITKATVSSTADAGIEFTAASTNIISHYTAANNAWNGVFFNSGASSGNIFNSLAIVNHDKGIQGAATGSGNIFYNVASTNNGSYAADLGATTSFSSFNGYFVSGGGTCSTGAGANLSGFCDNGSTAIPTPIALDFLGKITSDAQNPAGPAGTSSYTSINYLTAWLNFENFFRSWGSYNAAIFPNTTHKGACSTGTCQIWDWRVKTTASVLFNKSYDATNYNGAFTSGGLCSLAALNGNLTITRVTPANTFMMHADEIFGDGIGNDNGLCESSEDCIYAPNIGAYQGEGDFYAGGFCTTSGTVSSARIYSYPTTGI